jgi:streptomycin 3"-adenylyltransferase
VHFIREEDLQQWRHPFPYDFHYSEGWRDRYKENLTDLTWAIWRDRELTDVDLAAHFTIVRERGVALFGPAPRQVFPAVPPSDYVAAILDDYDGAMAAITEAPVYGVLNMLRVWWYLSEGRICSKEEAGVWGVQRLTDMAARSVAATALDRYRGGEETAEFPPAALEQFVHTVDAAVERFVSQGPAAHGAPFAPKAPPLASAPPAYGAMRCPHCGVALEYRGEGRFEAAAPVDLAMYACPSCGRAEFYVRQ